MSHVLLTTEQKVWFAERMDTLPTGRVRVPARLIEKYRTITGDHKSHKEIIKSILIDECQEYGI